MSHKIGYIDLRAGDLIRGDEIGCGWICVGWYVEGCACSTWWMNNASLVSGSVRGPQLDGAQ